ncbi:hypothetical protein PR048_027087 [Dryococelus australis]|uniref:Copia protein n=1 Tax=Dryococelus australis TaxID=614101 RepID=A0ABQ9GEG4_9NEOP|nr:hypothetical protein PR048_027087 [Dryococelus australis]
MEAEYIDASEAAKSLVWLDRLLKEVNAIDEESIPTLMMDNQSAIKLIESLFFDERPKHIEIRFHLIRQMVQENRI